MLWLQLDFSISDHLDVEVVEVREAEEVKVLLEAMILEAILQQTWTWCCLAGLHIFYTGGLAPWLQLAPVWAGRL